MNKLYAVLNCKPTTIDWFLVVSLFAAGLFNEYLSCAASVFLCIYLIIIAPKNKQIIFRSSISSISILSIALFYLLSCFWAVDPGMTFIGFLKILPLPLFMLVVMQEKGKSEELLGIIPPAAVLMTVISAIIMLFSPRNEYFAPAGRLAGFLQYSNTFALLLLIAVIITVTKDKLTKFDFAYLPILIIGIILSGSRTVFILTVVSVIVLIIASKNKTAKIVLAIVTSGVVVLAVIYAAITGNLENVGRFLSTSFTESTFIGRLLYYQDALPVVLRNPFGTGYLGYYYLQQSIQTGLYSVRYVHNDFLQLALDVGWIPTILLIIAAARSFFQKGASLKKRLLLFVISAHSFFDIDLQFIAIFMIYVLLLDIDTGKEYRIKNTFTANTVLSVIGCLSMYMLIPLTLAAFKLYEPAQTLYPWNTNVNTALMVDESDADKMDKAADAIIAQNKYVTVAYSAKAAWAFSKGNFGNVVKYKDMAIENAPLVGEEYEDYIRLLLIGREMYLQAGDYVSAEYCDKKIRSVLKGFRSIPDKLSDFGRMINDQPKTELSEELQIYLKEQGVD